MEPHGAWIPDLLPHYLLLLSVSPPCCSPAHHKYALHCAWWSIFKWAKPKRFNAPQMPLPGSARTRTRSLALSRLQLVAAKWKHTSRSQIARLHSSTTPQRGQRKKLPAAQWDKEGQRVAQIKWKFITIERARGREKLERLISSCDWHYWQYYARLDMCICGVKRLLANVGYSIMRICEYTGKSKTLLMARLSTLISLMILRKTA